MTSNFFKQIELDHANLKRPVKIIAGSVGLYHHSDANKCTHIYTTAGIVPVTNTVDEIDKLFQELNKKEV